MKVITNKGQYISKCYRESLRTVYDTDKIDSMDDDAMDFAAMLDLYCDMPKNDMVYERKTKNQSVICDINLEFGMPTVEQALSRMKYELVSARRSQYRIARLIHGYGSTGKGGAIRKAVRKTLSDAIPGEEFDIFHEATRQLLDRYPKLKHYPDLGRCNHGVTFVVLR